VRPVAIVIGIAAVRVTPVAVAVELVLDAIARYGASRITAPWVGVEVRPIAMRDEGRIAA
jgi:hypothetical protein